MNARKRGDWRKLSRPADLKKGLVWTGLSEEAAEEYLDDPNAIPKKIRNLLDEYQFSHHTGGSVTGVDPRSGY